MNPQQKTQLKAIGIVVVGLLTVWLLCRFVGEAFWFQEVGYLSVYGRRLVTKIAIWTIVTLVSAVFLLSNLALAQQLQAEQRQVSERLEPIYNPGVKPGQSQSRSTLPGLSLRWLLPIASGFSLLLALISLHYGQATWNLIQAYQTQPDSSLSMPARFRPETIVQLGQALLAFQTSLPFLGLGLLGLGVVALLVYPRKLFALLSILLSLALGFILSAHWDKVLLFFQAVPFDRADPLFGRDDGFYIFSLPVWELVEFWLGGLFLFGLLAVALVYLLAGGSLSSGRFMGFSWRQMRHLCWLVTGVLLLVALGYWLGRFELLYSTRGVTYGAGFTDVRVNLPVYTLLCFLSLAIAGFWGWQALTTPPRNKPRTPVIAPNRWWRSRNFLILAGYLVLMAIGGLLFPALIQKFVVQPNELALEQPYIRRNIALTREAFNLDGIDVQTFNPQGSLTYQSIQANDLTIRNIRLWDTRPLLQTIRQLQQFRPYYRFADADIDRYSISRAPTDSPGATASADKQQVLISARELDYSAVPQIAQTWVNEHLVYTHGYGFTMSPVNRVAPGGLPDYFVKDIGTGEVGNAGKLTTSSEQVRQSIPIDRPRIYYGEITNTYIMTGTKVQELDFPSGEDNVYNTYDGLGGVSIGAPWKRWLYAAYLGDWQMLFTENFTDQTRLLFRRNINQRIRMIAPFLTYDHDPYLVVADTQTNDLKPTGDSPTPPNSYLYWIVDAYTISDRYPYSDPTQIAPDEGRFFNYIRNSVKVVIDAYHGGVSFYVADPTDPMIQTWERIFPGMFKSIDDMPAALRSHVRFPLDLFAVQAERLLTYHMTDPQVFYNREDQWQVPTEIYGSEPQLVEPYYLIMELPNARSEEFILLLPFTPRQRTNLTAWLASRSDGENYGKSLLYIFPKQELVFGTEQIEARINQDPVISQQISLWNRQGSRAIQGNLLVIPIDQSLLYVEPLYLEAAQNSVPTLVRVIVAYENRIVMAETLEQSLRAIFQPGTPKTAPIVRPVE